MAVCVIVSRYNMSPLMYAARQGRVTIVESLLAVTADVNFQDSKGFTVCYVLCTSKKTILLDLDKKTEINVKSVNDA